MSGAMARLPRGQVLVGDAQAQLRSLPPESVDCVITSPPYFGLRDYGTSGQLGSEAHIRAWVEHLRLVAAEVQRVLKPTGSFWLNLGDGYSRHAREGGATKSLLLGPERVALALTEDGWLLRNKVVWAKTNFMPCSVRDRLACGYELVYFLTKQPNYYFDLGAIRVPAVTKPHGGRGQAGRLYPPPEAAPHHGRTSRVDLNHGLAALKATGREAHPLGKNPGDVWTQASGHYRGAHFATFPAHLVRRPLLATCPEQTCGACGTPWQRSLQRLYGRLLATGPPQPSCACGAEAVPGVVLDPFLGSGTTAIVAEEHGRDWVGIELNPAYAALAERRLADQRSATKPGSDADQKKNNNRKRMT